MKKLILILIVISVLFSSKVTIAQEGWLQLNSGTDNNLRSVFFIDANTGYVVGYNATILKTIDGGKNWSNQTTGISDSLYSVYFKGEFGFAVGGSNNPVILNTTNGGANWAYQNVPNSHYRLSSVYMLDSVTAFASGRIILNTTNGGINWESQWMDSVIGVPVFLISILFVNQNTGFASGNNLMHYGSVFIKTTDGGVSWAGGLGGPRTIFFINSNTGYGSLYCDGSRVIKTTNSGNNWINQYFTAQNYCTHSIWFANENTGYAVGSVSNNNGLVLKTNNGGVNWFTQTIPTTSLLNSVYFIDANTGFAVGNSGTILKTTNGGITTITSVSNEIPDKFSLSQNFPNPFNPVTKIKFSLPSAQFTKLKVFNSLGKEVATLVNQQLQPGSYEYTFDGSGLASGVYFYRLEAGEFVQTKRIVLLK